MPVIDSVRDRDGAVRIFFDLRPGEADPAEEVRITRLIERALTPQPAVGGAEVRVTNV
jgi:hypothetical protein